MDSNSFNNIFMEETTSSDTGTPPQPSEPVNKKKSIWVKVALGVVVFAAAVIALAFWLTSGIVDAVEDHLEAIRQGDVEKSLYFYL